jgi:Uri superfamily endonuclease
VSQTRTDVRARLPPGGRFIRRAADAPARPGVYVLLIALAVPVSVALPRREPVILPSGRYLYCGSAHGPGGLRARLARHMRPGKTLRWHVDRLTEGGEVLGAWFFLRGTECGLVAALACLPAPVPGFGSSDCRSCQSHLLRWTDGVSLPLAGRS